MRYFFLFISFFIGHTLCAQVEQPRRVEFEMHEDDERYSVVPAADRGIVLYREVKNTETKMERKWEVIYLDTALNVVWKNNYYVSLRYINRGYEYANGYFYILFQQNSESSQADLYVLRVDLKDQSHDTFLIKRQYPLDLTEFEVLDNTLIFAGYANTRPAVVCYEYGKNQPKVLPGFYNNRSELLQLELDDKLHIFDVLTSFKTNDGRKTISLKTFDTSGEMLKNITLRPSNERSLLYGRSVPLLNGSHLIVGTYTRKRSDLSRGIFVARIAPDGEHVINYYNYADLKNFFSYMRAKHEKRVRERIQRRKIRGKKNKFNYRLLVNSVVENTDHTYIMIGEAFYPKYSNSSFYTPYYSSYRYGGEYGMMFDGYRYTHAVVVGFDESGRLLWDNSFEIKDVESYNLEQFVHVSIHKDKIVLLYLYDNVIRTKIIEGNDVIEGKTFDDLKLSFENDEVSDTDSEYGGLESWYGNTLFAYGVQKIKNLKNQGVKISRKVFFINKITY